MTTKLLLFLAALSLSACGTEASSSRTSGSGESSDRVGSGVANSFHQSIAPPEDSGNKDRCSEDAVNGRLPDQATLSTWIETLRAQGLRVGGNPAHLAYIAFIKAELERLGIRVQDYPVVENVWMPSRAEFWTPDALGKMTLRPTATYYSHSGNGTVTAPAVEVGSLLGQYNWLPARGKIAVVKLTASSLTLAALAGSPQWLFDPRQTFVMNAPFLQMPALAVGLPRLDSGFLGVSPAAAGVLGVVVASDLPEAAVAGTFTGFQGPTPLPAVLLGRDGRAFADEALKMKRSIRLTTASQASRATVNSMIATIPGTDPRQNSLLLVTHTDGPNEVEENGPLGLISIARAIAGCNRRTVKLVFASGHMHYQGYDSGELLSVDPGQYRNLRRVGRPINTIGAISIEHLGAKHFVVTETQGLVDSGQGADPMIVLTSKTDPRTKASYAEHLKNAYIAAATKHDLERTFIAGLSTAGLGVLFGEGLGPDDLRIRTLGFIPLPEYLVKETRPDVTLVDTKLMATQISVFTEMVRTLQGTAFDKIGGY